MTRVYYFFFISVPEVSFRFSETNNLYKYLGKGYKVGKYNNQKFSQLLKQYLYKFLGS